MRLTALEIATACGGRLLQGARDRPVDGFSIDTRTLQPGDLFFALRGERFDGHEFLRQALGAGAAGVVVDRSFVCPDSSQAVAILVHDTLTALQQLATFVRRESGARVVAITGSAGKTTTKEIAAEFLAARYTVFRNRGNLNNHIGLPLSLLELRRRPEVAVVELGMNHPGEIRTLVSLARPDVRVWTNVGDAHLGFFESREAMADAKAEILELAGPGDTVVVNADDPLVMARASRFPGRISTFGIEGTADVRAGAVEDLGVGGIRAWLHTPAGDREVAMPLVGRGNLLNLLAATAVALHLSVPLGDIAAKAGALRPAHHRGEVVRLSNGVTLLDDSYNSSPSALTGALDVLARSSGFTRRGVVLGEMLELGTHSLALHEACGAAAARSGLAWLITVGGPPAEALARAASKSGMAASAVLHVLTSADAAEAARARVRAGDLVLVKGSRGIGTDKVVDRLKEAAA
jgi:UDP-N-acetylmuramoyl-tripeptide--D-alanyl-D-alanine ligase